MAAAPLSDLRPELLHLARECHGNWVEFHRSLMRSKHQRKDILAHFATRVRASCDAAVSGLLSAAVATAEEANDVAADVEDLKTAYAIFMAAELSFIDMADGDQAALCVLRWLRHNFLQAVTETQLAQVLHSLRTPTAVSDPDLGPNVWDLTAKLVIEGEPHDGGKLLLLYAQLLQSREMASFAQLLCAFPTVSPLTTKEAALTYQAAWREWKEQVRAFVSKGEQQRYPPFTRGHPQYLPVFHALAQVVAGDAWATDPSGAPTGLQALPIQGIIIKAALPHGANPSSPYARWYALAMCTILYGPVCPSAQGRSAVVHTMKSCITVQGLTCDQQVLQHGLPALQDSDLSGEHLRAAFMRIFEGDAVLACELLSLCGQEWASVALTELLWAAGPLQKAAPQSVALAWQPATPFALLRSEEGNEIPFRAFKLLAYAKYLCGLHPALAALPPLYAYAATPAAAMACSGMSERDVRVRLAQCGAEGRSVLSSGVPLPISIGRGNGSAFTPDLRAAKLAILSGSVPAAHSSVHTHLVHLAKLCVMRDDEEGMERCLMLGRQCDAATSTLGELCTLWAKHCLEQQLQADSGSGCSRPRLGTAFLWYLRSDSMCTSPGGGAPPHHDGCETWSQYCLALLYKAVDRALEMSTGGGLAHSRDVAESFCTSLRSSPDVLSIDGALITVRHWPIAATDLSTVRQHDQKRMGEDAQDSLTQSAILSRLLSACPTLQHLLAVRRMLEFATSGWAVDAQAGIRGAGASEVSRPAHEAFTRSAKLWTGLVGQRSVGSYPPPQEIDLHSWRATCRLLRVGTVLGLLHVKHEGRPAISAEQGLDVADRFTQHEAARTTDLASRAESALAVLRGGTAAGAGLRVSPQGQGQQAEGEQVDSISRQERKSLTEYLARAIADAKSAR